MSSRVRIDTAVGTGLVLAVLLALTALTRGEPASARHATPWRGPRGITMTMDELRRGPTPDVATPQPDVDEVDEGADRRPRVPDRIGPTTLATDPPYRFAGVWPRVQPVTMAFTALVGNGVPDPMGAIGPRQFLVVTNTRVKSFDKRTGEADGVVDLAPATFFRAVGQVPVDPNVRYDRRADKWLVGAISYPPSNGGSNRLLFAVSDSGVLTSTTRWTFFQFQFDQPEPAGNTGCSADIPSWGHDAIALYIRASSIRCPDGRPTSTTVFVVSKSSLYGSGSLVVSTFRDVDQAIASPVDDPDGEGGTGYFVSDRNVCRLVDAGGSPTLLPCVTIEGTQLFPYFNGGIRHLGNDDESGSTTNNDSSNDSSGRLQISTVRTKTAMTRRGHIWYAFTLGLDNAGQFYYANEVTRGSRLGVVWMDVVDIDTSRPRVAQSGRVFAPTADNDVNQRNYWIPSLAVSGQGHMMIGVSTAGSNEYVNAAAVGRLATDPTGVFRDPALYTSAFAAYNANDSRLAGSAVAARGLRRWGDYSHTSVDPCDDMTMWTVQQYTADTNKWGIAVARMSAPPPVTPTTAAPSVVAAGRDSVEVQLRGTVTDGAGFFDPGPGFQCRLRVDVPGATVDAVRVIDPATLSITLSTRGVSPGPLSVTITNPDGQSVVGSALVRVE